MQQIKFYFHPDSIENNLHVIEKDIAGVKKRYLRGIASGPDVDGHGERITENCVKSFHEQANSGDVLLYADKHDVKYTDDIGVLTKSDITPAGDWAVEFRLYDSGDGVGPSTLERADKLWKQVNGFPPYKAPKQKGFSIEGYIPEGGILTMSQDGRRVIDKVDLDGCVVVPRPAYQTSVAHAIYKALGEDIHKTARSTLSSKVDLTQTRGNYYKQYFSFTEALETSIDEVMTDPDVLTKKDRLNALFDEYRDLMVDLIINNSGIFQQEPDMPSDDTLEVVTDLYKTRPSKLEVLKNLYTKLDRLQKSIQGETTDE